MINPSRVLNSPQFQQPFTVTRSAGGAFINGVWTEGTPQTVNMSGIITVADAKTVQQVPEGDRITGAMLFYSTQEIYTTHADGQAGTSDKITWRGHVYKVMHVWPYGDYGYWKAYAVRIDGN